MDAAVFDVNNITDFLRNDGQVVSFAVNGKTGAFWRGDTNNSVGFAAGLWLLGKVNGELRTACTEYVGEFVPGPADSTVAADNRIYKINADGSGDWESWPFELGAPALRTADGGDSLDAGGNPIPLLLGDQTLWWVMNDLDAQQHANLFSTPPLGVEARVTVFGYAYPPPYDGMMFVKWALYNRSDQRIDDAYILLWSDDEVGKANDDLVGCDPFLNLAYCYNDGPDDAFGAAPPATGWVLLQGPVAPDDSGSAFAFGRTFAGCRNLPMTAFFGHG